MKLLASLKASNIERNAPEFNYSSFTARTAARAIVLDGNKVALIHVKEHNYFMLPGGGIEGEDIVDGLRREILEELGCEIDVSAEVGCIEVYFDRWSKKQTDFCYIAKTSGPPKDKSLTDFEVEEGHDVIWAESLRDASHLVEKATPINRDGKLVRARDLLFLQTALQSPISLGVSDLVH